MVQGVGLTLAPAGLYLSGLLRLVWEAAGAVLDWAGATAFSSVIWLGLALLGVAAVLWVVGGVVARRSPARSKRPDAAVRAQGAGTPGRQAAVSAGGPAKSTKPGAAQPPVDDDMAEIEALLKSRGIE